MPMKKSTQIVNALILNLPIAVVLCFVAQGLTIAQGQLPAFSWPMFFINFLVSYALAFVIAMTIPCVKWGFAFASKRAKPGTFKFGALLNVVVNSVYAIILCFLMSVFNVVILGRAPFVAAIFGFLADIVPVWAACYVVSLIFAQPAEKLARSITHDNA